MQSLTSAFTEIEKSVCTLNATLFVAEESGPTERVQLQTYLGSGGTKYASRLSNDRVLLCPTSMNAHWPSVVRGEVMMSKALTTLGLLSPLSKSATLSLSLELKDSVPVYTSMPFDQITVKMGYYIIDSKNDGGSTWKQGKHYLFQDNKARLKEENWDSVVNPLIKDIALLCLYNVAVPTDSLNLAVRKKSGTPSEYEIRYFGFDFVTKGGQYQMPSEKPLKIEEIAINKPRTIFDRLLMTMCEYEFADRDLQPGALSKHGGFFKPLHQRLVERYTPFVQRMIQRLSEENQQS